MPYTVYIRLTQPNMIAFLSEPAPGMFKMEIHTDSRETNLNSSMYIIITCTAKRGMKLLINSQTSATE